MSATNEQIRCDVTEDSCKQSAAEQSEISCPSSISTDEEATDVPVPRPSEQPEASVGSAESESNLSIPGSSNVHEIANHHEDSDGETVSDVSQSLVEQTSNDSCVPDVVTSVNTSVNVAPGSEIVEGNQPTLTRESGTITNIQTTPIVLQNQPGIQQNATAIVQPQSQPITTPVATSRNQSRSSQNRGDLPTANPPDEPEIMRQVKTLVMQMMGTPEAPTDVKPQGSDICGDQTNRNNVLLNLKAENAKIPNLEFQIHELQNENRHLKKDVIDKKAEILKLEVQSKEIDDIKGNHDAVSIDSSNLRKELQKRTREIKELKTKNRDLEHENESNEDEIQSLEAERDKYKEKFRACCREKKECEKKLQKLDSRISPLQEIHNDDLREKYQRKKDLCGQLQQENALHVSRISELEATIGEQAARENETHANNEELETRCQQLMSEVSLREEDKMKLEESNALLVEQLSEFQPILNDLQGTQKLVGYYTTNDQCGSDNACDTKNMRPSDTQSTFRPFECGTCHRMYADDQRAICVLCAKKGASPQSCETP